MNRLENETLPTFFRHRRFQSLVRQLNFYNFRKVNRERTFWVYHHQLFHRDRPEELHLLRRRTCPGVDGRKQRSDVSDTASVRSYSPKPTAMNSSSGADDDSDGPISFLKNKRKNRSYESKDSRKSRRKSYEVEKDQAESESDVDEVSPFAKRSKSLFKHESPTSVMNIDSFNHMVSRDYDQSGNKGYMATRMVSPNIFGDSGNRDRSNTIEQSVLVNKVAKRLEEHAKKAAAAKGLGSSKKSGTVTPPFSSRALKYHALTYDDEIEIYDSARGCVVERQQPPKVTSLSDEGASIISNDEEDEGVTGAAKDGIKFNDCNEDFSAPPVEDKSTISDIVRKLHGCAIQNTLASRVDGQLVAAVAGFCMLTNPRDVSFEEKCIELLYACGSLVTEFRRYKSALLPGSLPIETTAHRQTSLLDAQINQLFSDDKSSTIRTFKVFLLNNLEDLVKTTSLVSNVGLSNSESECLNDSYRIWMTALRYSE